MPKPSPDEIERAQGQIARALAGLQYGAVEVVVHAGRIVQIERREKFRFDAPASGSGDSTSAPGGSGPCKPSRENTR